MAAQEYKLFQSLFSLQQLDDTMLQKCQNVYLKNTESKCLKPLRL